VEPKFHPARPSWHLSLSNPLEDKLVHSADWVASKPGQVKASLAIARPSQRLKQSLEAD
jgi:hypothetical protein